MQPEKLATTIPKLMTVFLGYKMRNLLLPIMLSLCLGGCLDLNVKKEAVRPDLDSPEEGVMSFQSKEALASGATLQNVTANKVYYEGTEPKSEEAQLLLDMSYRFMGLLGVRTNFDPSDPESVKKVFEAADKAVEEQDLIIDYLQREVKDYNRKLLDAKTKTDAVSEGHKSFKCKVWGFIWSLIGFVILVAVVLGALQMFTGIPFLSGVLPWVVRRAHSTSKQTVDAVQKVRDNLKQMAENGESEETKALAKGVLGQIDSTLDSAQDAHVKDHIRKIKKGK